MTAQTFQAGLRVNAIRNWAVVTEAGESKGVDPAGEPAVPFDVWDGRIHKTGPSGRRGVMVSQAVLAVGANQNALDTFSRFSRDPLSIS